MLDTADDGIQLSMELSAFCDSECCTFTLPMRFHSAPAFLQCLDASPSSLPLGSVLGSSLITACRALYNTDPSCSPFHARAAAPKSGKCPENKVLVRQTLSSLVQSSSAKGVVLWGTARLGRWSSTQDVFWKGQKPLKTDGGRDVWVF